MNQQIVQMDAQETEPREGQQVAPATPLRREETLQEETLQEAPTAPEPADTVQASEHAVADAAERLVPVSEAKRYRKRAQAAEATLEEVKAQLAQNEEQIRRSEALIESLERRVTIDEVLVESDAVDLEAARLLVEQSLAEGEADDVESAVAEIKRRKPMLFRRSRKVQAVAQASRDLNGHSLHRDQLVRAASDASATGDRHDVLRYLRLRRRS
jgi:hypothetical protein